MHGASPQVEEEPVSDSRRMAEEVLVRLERLCEWIRRERIANGGFADDPSPTSEPNDIRRAP